MGNRTDSIHFSGPLFLSRVPFLKAGLNRNQTERLAIFRGTVASLQQSWQLTEGCWQTNFGEAPKRPRPSLERGYPYLDAPIVRTRLCPVVCYAINCAAPQALPQRPRPLRQSARAPQWGKRVTQSQLQISVVFPSRYYHG